MNKLSILSALLCCLAVRGARAQSIDDLELRKRRAQHRLGFGALGILETSVGLNRDRPELTHLIFVAPQLKIGDRMRLRCNLGLVANWLARQENPWDVTDLSLQFSHLGFYRDPWLGLSFSGYGRYYLPTSKASRNADSYGQLRLVGKVSRAVGRLYLALELAGQKHFHRYTTWSTAEDPGSQDWFHSAGRDAYIENNASYGFGETVTVSVSTLPGLDLSAIGSMYQSRHYQPDESHGDAYGSSLLDAPRQTTWEHTFRLVLDATYSLGAVARLRDTPLSRAYVSLGYAAFAPQLQNGGHDRSLNPFNPRYASVYLDLMFIY